MTPDEPSPGDYNGCVAPGECALCANVVCEADDGECECSLNGQSRRTITGEVLCGGYCERQWTIDTIHRENRQ